MFGELDVPEINFGNIKRTLQLGIFPFRAFLNLAMLITESEKARVLRQVSLDIAIDAINQRTGGGTKYAIYTDKIYRSIFRENAQEYRRVLLNDLESANPFVRKRLIPKLRYRAGWLVYRGDAGMLPECAQN